jgi:hypothetical protein
VPIDVSPLAGYRAAYAAPRTVDRPLERPETAGYHEVVWSGFLFARPSFLSGVARLIDLFGVFDSYNFSRTPAEVDCLALASDWTIVGHDLLAARDQVESEIDEQLSRQGRFAFAR